MSFVQTSYQDAIDDDPIPWYRFPDYPEKEKTLSYLTVNGEEPAIPASIRMQPGEYVFRGEYGTDFKPPGLERDVTWTFLHAKHQPPGLSFPTMLPLCFGAPMDFSQSTASAMQNVLPTNHQITDLASDRRTVQPAAYEPSLTIDKHNEALCRSLPPRTKVFCRSVEPVEITTDPTRAPANQNSAVVDSLMQDLEEFEFEEVGPVSLRPLIVSSDDWVQRRRSSQIREWSNENSAISYPSNLSTPERRISNRTSNTSLKSGFYDPQS